MIENRLNYRGNLATRHRFYSMTQGSVFYSNNPPNNFINICYLVTLRRQGS